MEQPGQAQHQAVAVTARTVQQQVQQHSDLGQWWTHGDRAQSPAHVTTAKRWLLAVAEMLTGIEHHRLHGINSTMPASPRG